MAEPIGLAASIVTLGALITGVGTALARIKHAPNEILAFRNELSDLQVSLTQIETLCGQAWPVDLRSHLQRAESILKTILKPQLEDLSDTLRTFDDKQSGDKRRRIKWMRVKGRIEHERHKIRATKKQLLEIFQLLADSTTRRISFQVDKIAVNVNGMRQAAHDSHCHVSTRLDGLQQISEQNQAQLLGQLYDMNSTLQQVLSQLGEGKDICAGVARGPSSTNNDLGQHSPPTQTTNDSGSIDSRLGSRRDSLIEDETRRSSRSNQEKISKTSPYESTISYFLSGRETVCSKFCSCSCHRRSRHLTSPSFAEQLAGQLLMGFTIRPWIGSRCDEIRCKRSRKVVIQIQYTFPAWFLAYCISISARPFGKSPEFTIRLPNVRPHTEDIFERVARGDIAYVQTALAQGLASTHDVENLGGHTLLHVSMFA